jgi:hypothetical protein
MVLVFGTISIVLVSYFAVRQVKSPIYLQEQAGKQQM